MALLFLLGGCSTSNAIGLAHQACQYVDHSLALYAKSRSEDGATSARDEALALNELREGLPYAATAAGEDYQFQGLMTTLAESSRVPEANLVNALRAQCASVGQ